MFKSLRLLFTVMVECIALPNITCMYSKLHAAIIQDIPKIKKPNKTDANINTSWGDTGRVTLKLSSTSGVPT